MEKLRQTFESFGFKGEILETVLNAFELQHYKKGEHIVEQGKVSRYMGLVENGMFQYYVWKDGEERTTYVNVEGTFLASVLSYISQTPALENVRAISDSSISAISHENLKKLVNEIPAFKEFYIRLLEQSICGIDASRHNLIVMTAEQRYEFLMQNEPHTLQLVPLQYISSMLGITPRHLSRIRKNIR
ncbi:MAG: Crp/Fnr family transcriptional regulator [Flavobacterium sp.]